MAKLGTKAIKDRAIAIIRENPGGIRYMDLAKRILNADPETSPNTISDSIWDLEKTCPSAVSKPSRGLYVPVMPNGRGPEVPPVTQSKYKEHEFYEPFALWLKNDLDEATDASALGGAGGEKWSTPDVVGVYKPVASDRIKFALEIIAVEIKIDPEQSIVAFGQAVAYRLFATNSYIVMPNTISEDDKSRLEALSMLHGIGFVLFTIDPANPDFTIRVRAQRGLPDMFYVNKFAERIRSRDESLYNRLFG